MLFSLPHHVMHIVYSLAILGCDAYLGSRCSASINLRNCSNGLLLYQLFLSPLIIFLKTQFWSCPEAIRTRHTLYTSSKNEYFILVIEILFSILNFPAPSILCTKYHIFYPTISNYHLILTNTFLFSLHFPFPFLFSLLFSPSFSLLSFSLSPSRPPCSLRLSPPFSPCVSLSRCPFPSLSIVSPCGSQAWQRRSMTARGSTRAAGGDGGLAAAPQRAGRAELRRRTCGRQELWRAGHAGLWRASGTAPSTVASLSSSNPSGSRGRND